MIIERLSGFLSEDFAVAFLYNINIILFGDADCQYVLPWDLLKHYVNLCLIDNIPCLKFIIITAVTRNAEHNRKDAFARQGQGSKMNDRPLIEGGPLRLRTHSIHIENRELMSITGVKDVGSFNDAEVILMTDGGGLTVEGEGLHITKLNLDEGQVVIEGQLIALEYDDVPVEKPGLFARMFR